MKHIDYDKLYQVSREKAMRAKVHQDPNTFVADYLINDLNENPEVIFKYLNSSIRRLSSVAYRVNHEEIVHYFQRYYDYPFSDEVSG